MHPMLTIAVRAARKAGNLIAKYYETLVAIDATQKRTQDYLINIKRDMEYLITEVIHKSYPQHTFLTEKCSVQIDGDKNIQWVIEPLDSMSSFIRRSPHFSVSIAVRIKGHTEVAVVYDPMRNDLFTASRGQGSQLNGYRLRGTYTKDLSRAMLAICVPFKKKEHVATYVNLIKIILTQCEDFRYTGSATLDLAYVAAGRIDGFLGIALKPWELTAGELLVRESGGLVTDCVGGHNQLSSGNVVAGNSRIVKEILHALRK